MEKKCKYCNIIFEDIKSRTFSNHVRWCNLNPNRKWRQKREKTSREEQLKKMSESLKRHEPVCCLCGCSRVFNNVRAQRVHLSHIQGRHPGWKHINEDINRRSYPEKYFISLFEKERLHDRFKIEEKFPFHRYFLDFAFINEKICLEIDGYQHYINEKNIEHDRIRNDFLISKGWRVYRINWSYFLKNKDEEIKKFFDFLNSSEKIHNYEHILYEKRRSRIEYIEQKMKERREKNREKYEDLIKRFDFEQKGWRKILSLELNISESKIKSWIHRYFPELIV